MTNAQWIYRFLYQYSVVYPGKETDCHRFCDNVHGIMCTEARCRKMPGKYHNWKKLEKQNAH